MCVPARVALVTLWNSIPLLVDFPTSANRRFTASKFSSIAVSSFTESTSRCPLLWSWIPIDPNVLSASSPGTPIDRIDESVERIDPLRQQAARQLDVLGIENVTLHAGDGSVGLSERAPFDRILVTAGAPTVPAALTQQLALGGRMLIPVGGPKQQRLMRIDRLEHGTVETPLLACRFVKLLGAGGWTR